MGPADARAGYFAACLVAATTGARERDSPSALRRKGPTFQATGLLGSPSKSVRADPVVRKSFRSGHARYAAELSINRLEKICLVRANDFHQQVVAPCSEHRLDDFVDFPG
jgi:hypothetical protein